MCVLLRCNLELTLYARGYMCVCICIYVHICLIKCTHIYICVYIKKYIKKLHIYVKKYIYIYKEIAFSTSQNSLLISKCQVLGAFGLSDIPLGHFSLEQGMLIYWPTDPTETTGKSCHQLHEETEICVVALGNNRMLFPGNHCCTIYAPP